jgi:hypothetical protein
MSRLRHAADLTYHLQQAVRHAIQLEGLLLHGIDTLPTVDMLIEDMNRAATALLDYRHAHDGLAQRKGKIE